MEGEKKQTDDKKTSEEQAATNPEAAANAESQVNQSCAANDEQTNSKPIAQELPEKPANELPVNNEPSTTVQPSGDQTNPTPTPPQSHPTSTASIDLSALLSSIHVPGGSDPPGYSNGDLSEEDGLRLLGKTAAFPDIPSLPNAQHATAVRCTAGEMEVAELRVKIICQEKNIMALKMELKAAELQVEAKNKVDAKKTRLVELLDNKLTTVERRNTKLLDMVEQMLKDKDGNTNRLKEATKNMQDLSQRLISSERHKAELMNANTELRKMLESIETKGSQIAKLAMEKVLKYKDANDQMQQELTELKDGAAAKNAESADKTAESADKTAESSAGSADTAAKTAAPIRDEMAAASEQLWGRVSELQQQTTAALMKVKEECNTEQLQKNIETAIQTNAELGVGVEEGRQKSSQSLSALVVENEQLRALVEDFDVVRREMERKETISGELLNEQKESITGKDKEIEDLKEELQRLKGAIGQLIGAK